MDASITQAPSRAVSGNQSPFFFLGVWPLYQTLTGLGVQPEVALRLPSVLAILAAIGAVSAWFYRRGRSVEAVVLCGGWIALDWVQLFYTTEARPYAAVQFFTLAGGMLAWRIVRGGVWGGVRGGGAGTAAGSPENGAGQELGLEAPVTAWWFVVGMAAIACHPTAILAVAAQVLAIVLFAVAKFRLRLVVLAVVLGAVLAAFAAALVNISPAWSSRSQWNAFAGDASYASVRMLLPQVHVLGIVVLAGLAVSLGQVISQLATKGGERTTEPNRASRFSEVGYWGLLAIVPIGLAWWLTYSELAPLMHRRYVISSLFPILVMAACCLDLVGQRLLRVTLVVATIAALMVVQGSPAQWRIGRWSPWQRLEGWRQAGRFIGEHSSARDELWCSSGLIEGNREPPLPEALKSYLDYPLSGLYRPDAIESSEVRPLVNDPRHWWRQVASVDTGGPRQVWIVHRGLGDVLLGASRRIFVQAKKEDRSATVLHEPISFGSVSVMCLLVEPASPQNNGQNKTGGPTPGASRANENPDN